MFGLPGGGILAGVGLNLDPDAVIVIAGATGRFPSRNVSQNALDVVIAVAGKRAARRQAGAPVAAAPLAKWAPDVKANGDQVHVSAVVE